jgi:hypothetical protein
MRHASIETRVVFVALQYAVSDCIALRASRQSRLGK